MTDRCLFAVLLVSSCVYAQEQTPAQPPQTSAATNEQRFETGTTEVIVPVTVTDDLGRFLPDPGPERP